MRVIIWALCLCLLVLPACAAQQRENGKYWVQKSTDQVHLGTNSSIVWMDECDGRVDPEKWGVQHYNCRTIVEPHVVSSPGVLNAIINTVGYISAFATLGAIMPGGSSSTNVNQSVTVPSSHHGHK